MNVELVHGLDKPGTWRQPHTGKWFAKTGGLEDHVCLTVSVPKAVGRSAVNTVALQGKKPQLQGFVAARAMPFGPIEKIVTEATHSLDVDAWFNA